MSKMKLRLNSCKFFLLNLILCLPETFLFLPVEEVPVNNANFLFNNNTQANLFSYFLIPLKDILKKKSTTILLVTLSSDEQFHSKPQVAKLQLNLNLRSSTLDQNTSLNLNRNLSELQLNNLIIKSKINLSFTSPSFTAFSLGSELNTTFSDKQMKINVPNIITSSIAPPTLHISNMNKSNHNNKLHFNHFKSADSNSVLNDFTYLLNKVTLDYKKDKHKDEIKANYLKSDEQFKKKHNLDIYFYLNEILDNLNLIKTSNSGYIRRRQRRLIKNNPGLIFALNNGFKLSLNECKHQFKNNRWNCDTNKNMVGPELFGKILNKACRETAFINAIHSAGIAYSITKACSDGLIDTCQCDYKQNMIYTTHVPGKSLFTSDITKSPLFSKFSKDELNLRLGISGIGGNAILNKNVNNQDLNEYTNDFQWSGCSDNINFAFKITKKLLDYHVKKSNDQVLSIRNLILLHNYKAGRLAIKENMITVCKCHGISGTCTMRTCWRRLSSFSKISSYLKERFHNANLFLIPPDEKYLAKQNEIINKYYPQQNLIYSEESPDFCTGNILEGFKGTKDRQCDPNSNNVNSCEILCCGRGYKQINKKIKAKCNCRFHWCCTVECNSCEKVVQIYQCV